MKAVVAEPRIPWLQLWGVSTWLPVCRLATARSSPENCQDACFWCSRAGSNRRPLDYQSRTLPAELHEHMAPREGLEPSRYPRSVAWRSLQLSYRGVLNGIPIVTGSDPESPVSFSLATTPFYEAFVFWRSGKDSNLQRLAPHRLSKPAAYRLAHRCMWRRIKDLNLWSPCGLSGFRNRRNRPALPILRMVPQRGIEPLTRGTSIRRSTI